MFNVEQTIDASNDPRLQARIERNSKIDATDTGNTKESSASILGAMKPTVGITPDGEKASIDDDITDFDNIVKEAFIEFAINPDALFTEKVASGLVQHANEITSTTLPFKVRKLTIERAALKVKLALFTRKRKEAPGSKYKQYKKRLVEVERALRKIQNSVDDAADRKQMAKAIDDLDKKVTKETKTKLQSKNTLESVNQLYYDLGSLQYMNGARPTVEFISEETIQDVLGARYTKFSSKPEYFSYSYMKRAITALKNGEAAVAGDYIDDATKEIKKIMEDVRKLPENTPESVFNKYYKFYKKMAIISMKIYDTLVKKSKFASNAKEIIPAIDVVRKDLVRYSAHDSVEIVGCFKRLEKSLKYISRQIQKFETSTVLESCMDDEYELDRDLLTMMEAYAEDLIDIDTYADMVLTEAKKPDDGIMEILAILNKKGYKTKYSCSGHKKSWKEDRNDDGIINGVLTSSARIMFKDDYNFPKPPKYWGFKVVDGKDYLYVLPVSHNAKKEDNEKAFNAWKNKYMGTLRTWVENLPDASSSEKVITKDKKGRDIVTESLNDIFESTQRELDEIGWWN